MRHHLFAAWAAAAILWQGCGGCDEAGCSDAVTVRVGDENAVAAELTMGGEILRCDQAASDDYSSGNHFCELTREPDGSVSFSFSLSHTVENISVRVFDRDGRVLIEQQLSPRYEQVRPNGEDCPPVCGVALVEL